MHDDLGIEKIEKSRINNVSQPTERRLFDIKYICKYLGLTEWSIRNLVRHGRIPTVRIISRRILFDKTAIDQWIIRNSLSELN